MNHLKSFWQRRKFLLGSGVALVTSLLVILVLWTSGWNESELEKDIEARLRAVTKLDASDPSIQSLAALGQPAVPHLTKVALWKPGIAEGTSDLVRRYDVLRPLQAGFPDQDTIRQRSRNRRAAVIALGLMGRTAKSALPALRRVTQRESWTERLYALNSIRKIGPERDDLKIFLEALNDEHRFCRLQGAIGLGELGELAAIGIPQLEKMLSDPYESVRREAKKALIQIKAERQ